jgi:hypothetical protein
MEIRHKCGDVREDGKVFWAYQSTGKEYWADKSKFDLMRANYLEKKNKYRMKNLQKILDKNKKYYQDNREQTLEEKKKDYVINREVFLKRTREYRKANWKKISINHVIYQRNRLETDPLFRLTHNLRSRLSHAFKRQGIEKTQTSFELTGCNREQLRQHLVSQFREGMTLENHGPVWHIDHIRPCASFDLSDKTQAAACFHYSNLQPLFEEENLAKSDSFNL